jgi:hypothetical protein
MGSAQQRLFYTTFSKIYHNFYKNISEKNRQKNEKKLRKKFIKKLSKILHKKVTKNAPLLKHLKKGVGGYPGGRGVGSAIATISLR